MKLYYTVFFVITFFVNSCDINTNQKKVVKEFVEPTANDSTKISERNIKNELPNKENTEVEEVALSFHKWFIRNTNWTSEDDTPKETTSFDVVEGENGKCRVDYSDYFENLRKLGTISEKFLMNEKERTSECAKYLENIDWAEYKQADAYEYDKFCSYMYYLYWTKSQENTETVSVVHSKNVDSHWEVVISLDNLDYRKICVKVYKEKGKYMITEMSWIQ